MFWTGHCIWMKAPRISMSVMCSTARTGTVRWHPSRKRHWKRWASTCPTRTSPSAAETTGGRKAGSAGQGFQPCARQASRRDRGEVRRLRGAEGQGREIRRRPERRRSPVGQTRAAFRRGRQGQGSPVGGREGGQGDRFACRPGRHARRGRRPGDYRQTLSANPSPVLPGRGLCIAVYPFITVLQCCSS